MKAAKGLLDELTDAYSTLEYLGREIATERHKVAYNYQEQVDHRVFEQWLNDIKTTQRRIEHVLGRLEKGDFYE